MNAPALKAIHGGKADLAHLADLVAQAKAESDAARKRYEELLSQLLEKVDVGEKGTRLEGQAACIELKPRIYQKVLDVDAIRQAVPEPLFNRLIRTKFELNRRELDYVRNNEPEWYRAIAPHIEIKPGKPAVLITEKA